MGHFTFITVSFRYYFSKYKTISNNNCFPYSEMSVHVAIRCNELAYHIQKLDQGKVYVIRYKGYAFLLS